MGDKKDLGDYLISLLMFIFGGFIYIFASILGWFDRNMLLVLSITVVLLMFSMALNAPEPTGCNVHIEHKTIGCCEDCQKLGKEYFKYNSGGWSEPSCWCIENNNNNNNSTIRIW